MEEALWLARRDHEDVGVAIPVRVGLFVIAGVAVCDAVRGGVPVPVVVAVTVTGAVWDPVGVGVADIEGVNV